MDDWKTRLRQAREAAGLNKTKFADMVGVSNPTVTDWEKTVDAGGIQEIAGSRLMRVCDVLHVSAEWLLDGRPTPGASDDPRARLLVDTFNALDDRGRETLLAVARSLQGTAGQAPS